MHVVTLCRNIWSIFTVETLIAHQASINLPDSKGRTPLLHAVCDRHVDIVKILIAHNADVNIGTAEKTPLQIAAQNYIASQAEIGAKRIICFDIAYSLIKAKANVNAIDSSQKLFCII